MKNPAAVALGKLAKGVHKKFSDDERARRRERLSAIRVRRWPAKTPPADLTADVVQAEAELQHAEDRSMAVEVVSTVIAAPVVAVLLLAVLAAAG